MGKAFIIMFLNARIPADKLISDHQCRVFIRLMSHSESPLTPLQTGSEMQGSVCRGVRPVHIQSSFIFIAKNSNILMSNLHQGNKDSLKKDLGSCLTMSLNNRGKLLLVKLNKITKLNPLWKKTSKQERTGFTGQKPVHAEVLLQPSMQQERME